MNAMSLSQWIFAAAVLVAAVSITITLFRAVRLDGYGRRPAPDPRSDWGTPTLPSLPYNSRF